MSDQQACGLMQVATIFVPVADQERALRYYVDALGFEKRVDFVYGGGVRWVEARFRVAPVRWIAAGLLTALGTGLGAWLFGRPFLTSYFTYLEAPVLGRIPLPTAMAFDLGVLILVVGATTLILTAIGHQSLRKPRRPEPTTVCSPLGSTCTRSACTQYPPPGASPSRARLLGGPSYGSKVIARIGIAPSSRPTLSCTRCQLL